MAKAKPSKKQAQQSKKNAKKSNIQLIPEKYQDLAYILLIIIAVFIFFASALSGEGFNATDTIASESFKNFLAEAKKQGEFPLWIPYIFSGMPSYGSLLTTGERLWDIVPQIIFGFTHLVGDIFSNDVARMAMFYVLYGIGMYLLMKIKRQSRFISFFTAIAAVFSTSVIVWVMIGHNTKPIVFAMLPWVILFLERLREKFSIIYAVLLTFAIHIMMEAGHIQMIYYAVIAVGIYFLFELISRIIKKSKPSGVLYAAGVAVVAAGLAFLMSSDRYFATLEYTPYSTRGSASLEKRLEAEKHPSDVKNLHGGLVYDEATQYSFSPAEMMTFLVPNYFGFGKKENELGLGGGQGQSAPKIMNYYWGQKEIEDAPPYMGAAVLLLAIIGFIIYRRDPFMQFLFATALFALLVSFGKNWPYLYDLLYNNLPYFNKFRAPSMILALTQFAVPIMAGYGISGIWKMRENFTPKDKKLIYGVLIGTGLFLVIGFIYSAAFKMSYMENVAEGLFKVDVSKLPMNIQDYFWSEVINDWILNGVFLVAIGIMAFFVARGKMGKPVFYSLLALILFIDLFRVSSRPKDIAEVSLEDSYLRRYEDVYKFIQQDTATFRISDPQRNIAAYYLLESTNGYHAAKPRIYQDLLDYTNNQPNTYVIDNPYMLNMLNCKYIIGYPPKDGIQPIYVSQRTRMPVYPNPDHLPRCFFVDMVEKAGPMEILNKMKYGSPEQFDPRVIAYLEEPLDAKIDPIMPGAKAKVVKHENHYIKIEANATGNNFLFVSEIYYPPGWKAYIDGEETEIYKTNYAFRGLVVPEGKHTIEFKFHSSAFETGRTLSLIVNILTILALIGGVILERRKSKKNEKPE